MAPRLLSAVVRHLGGPPSAPEELPAGAGPTARGAPLGTTSKARGGLVLPPPKRARVHEVDDESLSPTSPWDASPAPAAQPYVGPSPEFVPPPWCARSQGGSSAASAGSPAAPPRPAFGGRKAASGCSSGGLPRQLPAGESSQEGGPLSPPWDRQPAPCGLVTGSELSRRFARSLPRFPGSAPAFPRAAPPAAPAASVERLPVRPRAAEDRAPGSAFALGDGDLAAPGFGLLQGECAGSPRADARSGTGSMAADAAFLLPGAIAEAAASAAVVARRLRAASGRARALPCVDARVAPAAAEVAQAQVRAGSRLESGPAPGGSRRRLKRRAQATRQSRARARAERHQAAEAATRPSGSSLRSAEETGWEARQRRRLARQRSAEPPSRRAAAAAALAGR
jgi:hypothetical protein